MISIVPPAASIFDFAVSLDTPCALIVSFFVSSPSPRIFTCSTSLGTRPFARSVVEVDRRAGVEHLLERARR